MVTPEGARFIFDIGNITPDAALWALETVRAHRDLLPTDLEGDVVGAGFHNDSGSGLANVHPDHTAVYDLLRTTDLGLPGSQMSPVGHLQPGRAFGATVNDYCAMMCHPGQPVAFRTTAVGAFQYAYGWLGKGMWPAAERDQAAGFSRYQSFGKWF